MSLKDELFAVEQGLWKNDPDLYHDSLLPGVQLVFPETGVITRETAVEAIRKERAENRLWEDVRFEDVRATPLSDEVASLTYLVHARWNYETAPNTSIASSIYVRRGNAWKLALHQQGQVPAR